MLQEGTWYLERWRVKKGLKDAGEGLWYARSPVFPKILCVCMCVGGCSLTCVGVQAEPSLLVPADHAVAGLLGARASEGGQPQNLRATLGILGHLHTVLGVQEHGQVVIQAHHGDGDGAQRGQRYWGAQVRGTDGELQCCLWPDPQWLLQADHACGGFNGKAAFGRVRERVNHLGIGACGGRQSA